MHSEEKRGGLLFAGSMPDNRGAPMFDFKFLKDRYDFELTRKEQITNALTMPIGADERRWWPTKY